MRRPGGDTLRLSRSRRGATAFVASTLGRRRLRCLPAQPGGGGADRRRLDESRNRRLARRRRPAARADRGDSLGAEEHVREAVRQFEWRALDPTKLEATGELRYTAAPGDRGTEIHLDFDGVSGAPGAGKSTLARAIGEHLGSAACIVGMDGFHLAQRELDRLGRAERKGAPDTFDAAGCVALMRRLRDPAEEVVYATEFRRAIEEPIAGAVAVAPDVPVIITEGNYLLLEEEPRREVRGLLDEAWFALADEQTRPERLIARHVQFGRSPAAARAWVLSTDQRNADIVSPTRHRADAVVLVD